MKMIISMNIILMGGHFLGWIGGWIIRLAAIFYAFIFVKDEMHIEVFFT